MFVLASPLALLSIVEKMDVKPNRTLFMIDILHSQSCVTCMTEDFEEQIVLRKIAPKKAKQKLETGAALPKKDNGASDC